MPTAQETCLGLSLEQSQIDISPTVLTQLVSFDELHQLELDLPMTPQESPVMQARWFPRTGWKTHEIIAKTSGRRR